MKQNKYYVKNIIYILFILSFIINAILLFKIIKSDNLVDEEAIERTFYVETSKATDNVNNLITKIYTDKELDEINSLKLNYKELNKLYLIECVRYVNNFEYCVTYKGEGKYLIIKFNKSGEKKSSQIYNSQHEKSSFSFIKFGDKFSNIKDFDDSGFYHFWYAGNVESEYKSYHYTTDGYIIILTYDEYLEVIGIEEQLI